jgi:hypothetical protein
MRKTAPVEAVGYIIDAAKNGKTEVLVDEFRPATSCGEAPLKETSRCHFLR